MTLKQESARPAGRGLRFTRLAVYLQAGLPLAFLSVMPAHGQAGPLAYDFRGLDGTCCSSGSHPNNGHDGQWGQRDFIQGDSGLNIVSGNAGQAGILADVSGGNGGNGRDWQDSLNHWGGNGGGGRNLDYSLSNSTVSSAGRGVDLYSAGGNGGLYGNAYGPNGGYGIGGDGHLARITLNGVSVVGKGFGVAAQSWGGTGSHSALAGGFGGAYAAGWGGNAGQTSVILQGATFITARGAGPDDVSAGVGLLSQGGSGGTAEHTGDFGGHSDAGRGGNASEVDFTSSAASVVSAQGDGVHGISARSIGGDASVQNDADTKAAAGGDAGQVSINNGGKITATGNRAVGILALSQGGQGGNGGDGTWGGGHDGGSGGMSGAIQISNTGSIATGAAGTVGAKGIVANVLGGEGGPGGSSGASGHGGNGGGGGPADQAISIGNAGSISTLGNDAAAVLANSAGGGGGLAASSNGIIAVGGGHGGTGGIGGILNMTNTGNIETAGDHSAGVSLQSIGGGGGFGGDANATGVIAAIAIGGSGGAAGDGGGVSLTSKGRIGTAGANSTAVVLQSIGGGGGSAGSANAVGVGVGLNVTVSTGGSGGSGGSGGAIAFTQGNQGSIISLGEHSHGILAQSIGGGGGNGGMANSRVVTIAPPAGDNPTGTAAVSISHGGAGQGAGNGGTVSLANGGSISAAAAQSSGMGAQSIGGGGGNGGGVLAPVKTPAIGDSSFNLQFNLRHGAQGGAGGEGGRVTAGNNAGATLTTAGVGSTGILAQSIGGGGGNGGIVQAHDADSFNDILGSPELLPGLLDKAISWLEKGPQLEFRKVVDLSASVTTGGSGGAGGEGGTVSVRNEGSIASHADHAPGILVQSIGGGGGNAGAIDSAGASSLLSSIDALIQASENAGSHLFTVGLPDTTITHQTGGSGGAGGDGGGTSSDPTMAWNSGRISTRGDGSAAIVVQSVGGGGGRSVGSGQSLDDVIDAAGGGKNAEILAKITRIIDYYATKGGSELGALINIHNGGKDGAGGQGGVVTVDASASSSSISTQGDLAPGIVAQSIGGGGGISAVDPPLLVSGTAASDIVLGATTQSPFGLLSSGAGQVTVNQGGSLATEGDLSFGILAQSIGGGGGYVAMGGAAGRAPMNVTFGASGLINGAGSGVAVSQGAGSLLSTSGANAHGVVAQSVGGGGGIAGLSTRPGLVALKPVSTAVAGGDGGAVGVSVGGTVLTHGDGAAGVLAQSVGGGGGLAGDQSSARYGPSLIQQAGLTGGRGNGGGVNIAVDANAEVRTSGMNAPAILAMSIGGGGVFNDGALYQYDTPGQQPAYGGTVSISLGQGAAVTAGGAGSPAVVALSNGAYGGGGAISINLAPGSILSADNSSGMGIIAITPLGSTTITNAGTIQAKTAINAPGPATVNNNGLVAGDVLVGSGSRFNNNAGAHLHSGATFQGALNNAGTLSPGGQGVYQATRIEGALHSTGTYRPDLDFGGGRSDMISVAQASSFGGTVKPVLHNPIKDVWLDIAHFDVLQTSMPATQSDSPLFSYTLRNGGSQGWSDPSISASADFTPAGFSISDDRARIAGWLQALWDTAPSGGASVFDKFTGVQTSEQYEDTLNRVAHDGQFARAANAMHFSYVSMNRLMSCPRFVDSGTIVREGDCAWGRIDRSWTRRGQTAGDESYRIRQSLITLGGQREIHPNWFLGGSLGYSRGDTSSPGVSADSDTFAGGIALKYNRAPWQLAAAVHGGFEKSRMSRSTLDGVASSRPKTFFISGRLRVAYEISRVSWYVRPYVDLDMSHVRQKGYQEQGSGLFNLEVHGQGNTSFMVSPMIEVGGRTDLRNGAVLRSYLAAGGSFLSGGDVVTTMRPVGFDIAPFSLKSGMPSSYGNVSAGLEYISPQGLELKMEYSLRAGPQYRDQTLAARAAYRF